MTDHIAAFKASDSDLKHAGVKGMKWGVRKDRGGKPRGKLRRAATKANVALNAGAEGIEKGEKKLIFLPHSYRAEAASRTQTRVLGEARQINKSPEFKGKDLKRDPALKASYYNQVSAKVSKIYQEELNQSRADAIVDVLSVTTKANSDRKMSVKVKEDELRHADGDVYIEIATVDLTLDGLGQIEDLKMSATADDLLHSDLMHYGVKGMKWGRRKAEVQVNEQTGEVRIAGGSKRSGKKLAAEVERHPEKWGLKRGEETSGAKYARLLDQAKKEGANSFTDEELRFVTQRGNAINQVNKLNEKKPGWVQNTAKQVFQQSAQKQMTALSNDLIPQYVGSKSK